MSLKFLEDWLLFMGGLIDQEGNTIPDPWRRQKPIKLATYDTRFIESVGLGLRNNTGLTDRQVLLAIKVVLKYKRQWTQLGLDPSYLESEDIPLRLPQRQVDRTHAAWIEDKKIYIKFPYDPKIITRLNSAAAELPGNWTWNTESKNWSLDLLECNVHELVRMKIFDNNEWKIDDRLQGLLSISKSLDDSADVRPMLDLTDDGLVLLNCPEPLIDSMHQHGFTPQSDILRASLLAFKHGMLVTNSILAHYPASDPRRMLLEAQFPTDDSYPGQSNMTWGQLNDLMTKANEFTYVFLYRTNNMPRVMSNTKDYYACKKEYITVKSGSTVIEVDNPKESIFVTDVLIGNPAMLEVAQKYLGVLYMIADDERVDA